MSHQTGIRANEELRQLFSHCKNGKVRMVKVMIVNEELTLAHQEPVRGELEQDYGSMVPTCLNTNEPCYVLFRLDNKSNLGHDWLLVSYSPESAPVRQKMLLAATRATLKTEFGQAYIKDELHAPNKEEATLDGYRRHLKQKAAPGPMTELEQELNNVRMEEKEAQKRAMEARSLPTQTLRGVAFPIDQNAQEKLAELRNGQYNYIQLSVDTLNEAIKLEKFENVSVGDLGKCIPRKQPRYHFYAFKHTYNGENLTAMVFLYSMPSGGCSIKERMLYSSCKSPFLDTVERFIGIKLDRKIEIDSTESVTEDYLMDQVHPPTMTTSGSGNNLFAKPRGPPGRGLPRITKPVQ